MHVVTFCLVYYTWLITPAECGKLCLRFCESQENGIWVEMK